MDNTKKEAARKKADKQAIKKIDQTLNATMFNGDKALKARGENVSGLSLVISSGNEARKRRDIKED
jgi:septal ring factor EnvC (AmiA/AmiB activator)